MYMLSTYYIMYKNQMTLILTPHIKSVGDQKRLLVEIGPATSFAFLLVLVNPLTVWYTVHTGTRQVHDGSRDSEQNRIWKI